MGAVDLVVQIETPPSVASGLQRIGRGGPPGGGGLARRHLPEVPRRPAGHRGASRARCRRARSRRRASRRTRWTCWRSSSCAVAPASAVDDLFALVRRAAPFAALAARAVRGRARHALGPLPLDEFAELRPRLTWDRLRGHGARARRRAALVVANAGTIPDRGLYGVFLAPTAPSGSARPAARGRAGRGDGVREPRGRGVRAGRVDLAHRGDHPRPRAGRAGPGEPGRMPFWKGDRARAPGRAGRAIGRLTRELLAACPGGGAAAAGRGARARRARGREPARLPRRPEGGDRRRARRPHARARAHARRDGRLAAVPALALGRPRARALGAGAPGAPAQARRDPRWRRSGATTASWCACPTARDRRTRPRSCPSRTRSRTWWWASWGARRSSPRTSARRPPARCCCRGGGPASARRSGCSASARPTCSRSPRATARSRSCWRRTASACRTCSTCPASWTWRAACGGASCGSSRWTRGAVAVLGLAAVRLRRELPLRRRRAAGRAPRPGAGGRPGPAARAAGRGRAARAAGRPRRWRSWSAAAGPGAAQRLADPDRLHDLLLRIGDLTLDGVGGAGRGPCGGIGGARWPGNGWSGLELERRAIRVVIAGEERFAAAEDAGRLRDAFGVAPPPGCRRPSWAGRRMRCASSSRATRARTGRSGPPTWRAATASARRRSRPRSASCGARARPGRRVPARRRGREWCETDVLATLRRRSLARLRKQVEPAEPAALARLLLDWQGIDRGARTRGGPDALLDVVEQLQGAVCPGLRPGARHPARAPPPLPSMGPGRAVRRGRGGLGGRAARSAIATAGSPSTWPTTCRCCTAPPRSRRRRSARAAARAPRPARRELLRRAARGGGRRPCSGRCWTRSGTWSGRAR